MIRLGHIGYSNCYPVHAMLLEGHGPVDVQMVSGTPAQLNRALAEGAIDVAPCSSIEYARSAGRYRILPDFAIASEGPVQSILLECLVPPAELGSRTVMMPTASATSVVLLRILLEEQLGLTPSYEWFNQENVSDPFTRGAAAALWIGDIALERRASSGRTMLDLGEAWTRWTGLPFVYAMWQTWLGPERADELGRLHQLLIASHTWFEQNKAALAARHALSSGRSADYLLRYWDSLRYRLEPRVEQGLLRFFASAARLGEAPASTTIERVSLAAC
jgi:chorismate dehydratase